MIDTLVVHADEEAAAAGALADHLGRDRAILVPLSLLGRGVQLGTDFLIAPMWSAEMARQASAQGTTLRFNGVRDSNIVALAAADAPAMPDTFSGSVVTSSGDIEADGKALAAMHLVRRNHGALSRVAHATQAVPARRRQSSFGSLMGGAVAGFALVSGAAIYGNDLATLTTPALVEGGDALARAANAVVPTAGAVEVQPTAQFTPTLVVRPALVGEPRAMSAEEVERLHSALALSEAALAAGRAQTAAVQSGLSTLSVDLSMPAELAFDGPSWRPSVLTPVPVPELGTVEAGTGN